MTTFDRTFVFAQQTSESGGVFVPLISLAILAAVIAGVWKVFTKAGQPGWGALIPIYNVVLLLQIAKRPLWWLLLLLVPLVNMIVAVIVSIDIAKQFGKGPGFGLGLAFLGFVFYPVLGFSDARYQPA
jgi:hypothetical protein